MACTWLTVKEAADFLKVDKSTLYKYIKEGRLKVSRPGGPGGNIRVCLEVLNALGEENSPSDHTG